MSEVREDGFCPSVRPLASNVCFLLCWFARLRFRPWAGQTRDMERDELSAGSEYAMNRTVPADPWEAAYLRFETPEQEIRKFVKRLRALGVCKWPPDAQIVELFCGRGNGLRALQSLGFTRVEGVDLSPSLVAQYQGSARCYVGDCRQLPF